MSKVKWNVRYKSQEQVIACSPELAAMLACFASTGDLRAQGENGGCAAAARKLHACMKKQGKVGRTQRSSINYLLSKVK